MFSLPADVEIENEDLGMINALTLKYDDKYVILISSSLKEGEMAYRMSLLHEIAHIQTGTFYSLTQDKYYILKCEYKAKKWLALKLMPIELLEELRRKGITEVWQIADYLDITEDLVYFRLSLPDVRWEIEK